ERLHEDHRGRRGRGRNHDALARAHAAAYAGRAAGRPARDAGAGPLAASRRHGAPDRSRPLQPDPGGRSGVEHRLLRCGRGRAARTGRGVGGRARPRRRGGCGHPAAPPRPERGDDGAHGGDRSAHRGPVHRGRPRRRRVLPGAPRI
ncbi:MAG: hypothetical protein AVDCRST_MAG18-2062, partial [uncultured Thermomicrobiales bacterium]